MPSRYSPNAKARAQLSFPGFGFLKGLFAGPERPELQDARIFRDVWKASGLRGAPPPVWSEPLMPNRLAGRQGAYNRIVALQPEIARGMVNQALQRDPRALEVLLHEYAHVNQPRVMKKYAYEGAAEVWALKNLDRVARKVGVPMRGPGLLTPPMSEPIGAYPGFRHQLAKRPGAGQFIQRGQFGETLMGLSAEQVPYTGPKGSDATKHDHEAPTIEALKRAMVRLGFLDKKLSELDGFWGQDSMFDDAFGKWSLKKGFQDDHVYGEGKWEEIRKVTVPSGAHKGEPALDSYAQELIRDEHATGGGTTTAIEQVRKKIVAFCEQGLKKPGLWNYTQNRSVDLTVDPWGGSTINSDCSGSVLQAVHHAKKVTGLNVKDPSKQNWSGYGNTDLYEDDWPKVSGNYLVGDLGHYEGHVTLCILKGTWDGSRWWSFGSEPPSKRKLDYRNDFRLVCRPVYL